MHSFIEIRNDGLYCSNDDLGQLKDSKEKEMRPFSAMDRVSSCFNLHTEDYEAHPEKKRYVSVRMGERGGRMLDSVEGGV